MISEARELVLIDTCVWAAFFSRSDSTEKRAVTELVRTDRAAIIGPIGAEVLRGFRRDAEADWASAALEGVHYFELDWDDWRRVARLGRETAAKGHQLPLSDLAVATAAFRNSAAVFSTDPHFDIIPNLKRFRVN